MCETCGYRGNCVETHALFAVLNEDRAHAMNLVEDWNPRERAETGAALVDLLGMVGG